MLILNKKDGTKRSLRHNILVGVCTDTYVIYQSVLEKKTYELAIHR